MRGKLPWDGRVREPEGEKRDGAAGAEGRSEGRREAAAVTSAALLGRRCRFRTPRRPSVPRHRDGFLREVPGDDASVGPAATAAVCCGRAPSSSAARSCAGSCSLAWPGPQAEPCAWFTAEDVVSCGSEPVQRWDEQPGSRAPSVGVQSGSRCCPCASCAASLTSPSCLPMGRGQRVSAVVSWRLRMWTRHTETAVPFFTVGLPLVLYHKGS